ncbi:MAG: DUF2961 domain-containing protein [Sedimentisphaerales bacterium]|nr:DUF2961 domain-containing protein [Sedimentisphaerales bacterium]
MTKKNFKSALVLLLMGTVAIAGEVRIYEIEAPVESRSISFENPTGEKGKGGTAASKIGAGRKGLPAKDFKPGQTYTLCDIQGHGVIRHIWVTVSKSAETLQGIVVRVYWDGQEHPSIETPLGALFGIMHGKVGAHQSAVHSVNPEAGMNIWLEMPFAKRAKITLTNESTKSTPLFYYIDYTLGDKLPSKFGRLHAMYRRENPTTLKNDFEILPKRTGSGRFLGCVIGIRTLEENWWGEGEFKVYLDGDREFSTICGTGTEDYIGQSWGLQNVAYLYGGTSLMQDNLNTIYRWHIKDPIYWKKDVRITIQQIGWSQQVNEKTGSGLYERQDDWSCCAFWYEPIPSAKLPELPDYAARIKDYAAETKPK